MNHWLPAQNGNRPAGRYPRMEYGKFTDGHGYAERRDHSELARSPQFPPVLAAYCGPRLSGPSRREGEPLPSWAKHGTVLQPVLAGSAVFQLCARVAPTPERSANRIYLRARFLAGCGTAASPGSLFAAMDSEPLGEFVRRQSPATVEPLTAAPSPSRFRRFRVARHGGSLHPGRFHSLHRRLHRRTGILRSRRCRLVDPAAGAEAAVFGRLGMRRGAAGQAAPVLRGGQ